MLEMGLLLGMVLALGITLYLLRRTDRSEPTPEYETESDESRAPGPSPASGRTRRRRMVA